MNPTHRDVGNADLVGNIDRPTYKDVGNADLVGNIDRPTYKRREPEYSRSGAEAQRREEETCFSELREQSFNSSPRRCESHSS
jgi:hypothetical protein